MPLADDFDSAQRRVKELKTTPTNDELLELYSLYKQATVGDVGGKRPGMLDFRARAKFDAWAARKGMDRALAMQGYVDAAGRLAAKYG